MPPCRPCCRSHQRLKPHDGCGDLRSSRSPAETLPHKADGTKQAPARLLLHLTGRSAWGRDVQNQELWRVDITVSSFFS